MHVYGGVLTARFNAIRKLKGNPALLEMIKELEGHGYGLQGAPDSIKGKKKYDIGIFLMLLNRYKEKYG